MIIGNSRSNHLGAQGGHLQAILLVDCFPPFYLYSLFPSMSHLTFDFLFVIVSSNFTIQLFPLVYFYGLFPTMYPLTFNVFFCFFCEFFIHTTHTTKAERMAE